MTLGRTGRLPAVGVVVSVVGIFLVPAAGAGAAPARVAGVALAVAGAPGAVKMTVDTAAGRRPISPLIYGINLDKSVDPSFAAVVAETHPGLIRLGGNRWTAYNWEINASNAGSDYQYQNDNYLSASNVPGAAVLSTVRAAVAAGAATIVTVPVNGYVSADESPPGPVTNSGPNYLQTRFDVESPTDPAPLSTVPVLTDHHVYENQFVYWLMKTEPKASVLFSLDNEPDLWDSTHSEVHKAQPTYAEILAKDVSYAAALKKVWPQAAITGPVSYGWEGYETFQNAPDSAADGNFLNWYLKQVALAGKAARTTLVNDLDLHWYPEATGDGQRITNTSTAPGVVAAREQAPRSLWDPTYVENSWITADSTGGKAIDLIPRVGGQIATADPGAHLDFTEWNYGAGQAISGGIATADVLGIFGKYGVRASAVWPLNGNESYTYGAFAMFRNYDGHDAGFGDTEVSSATSDPVDTSVYASIDKASPNRVVIVAVNKNLTATPATITLSGGPSATRAAVFTLTSAASVPKAAPSLVTATAGTFSYAMPAQSVSVIVPVTSASSPLPPAAVPSGAGSAWAGEFLDALLAPVGLARVLVARW